MANKNNHYYKNASVYDEAIRTLRTNIQFSNVDDPIRKMVVTSALPNEGKSTISVELARSFAQTGIKVVLMDCDLRNPSVGKVSGSESNIGVTNILMKKTDIMHTILQDEKEVNLDLILSGPIPPNPAELINSKAMENLINELENRYDMIIIDTPPVGILTDAAILSTKTDGVALVVKTGETKKVDINNALENISKVNGKVLGVVMTYVKSKTGNYGYYYGKN